LIGREDGSTPTTGTNSILTGVYSQKLVKVNPCSVCVALKLVICGVVNH